MNEAAYQKQFLKTVPLCTDRNPRLLGSIFFPEVKLKYDIGKLKASKDFFMPDTSADFLELDAQGKFHLWEAKLLFDNDFLKAKVLGQMIFYDFLFTTDHQRTWLELSPFTSIDAKLKNRLREAELKLHSWNILVCGGNGWELAAGVNPQAWLYQSVGEAYFHDNVPSIETYHLFHTKFDFDIWNLWQLSVLENGGLHPDSEIAYAQSY
jgi:hypothetical protein